jgi:hypothetical protein
MKKTKIQMVEISRLQLNRGQLKWLPRNPRQWTQADIDKMARSLERDPDFVEERPVLATPGKGDALVVFAHNLLTESAGRAGRAALPAVIYTPENEDDRETIRRRALLDNGAMGRNDTDILANEWPYELQELVDFGYPDFSGGASDMGLTTKGREGEDGYDEFVDKFKQKLTTDDCYTPPAVYDAVKDFVGTLTDLKDKTIERPFFPGGDFENYNYTKRSIVIDNPPFSILSKICRFYAERGIPFFLFAPSLTLFTATDCDLTYIVSDTDIEYENGARVRTGFITNLIPDLRIWCCPELARRIAEAQPEEDKTKQGFVYPDNIVTAAILQKITKRDIELKIRKVSCEAIKQSDSAEEQGRALYGGGFIMSDRAAAERAAAERAAAERAAATRLNLSEREKAIIERLNQQDK